MLKQTLFLVNNKSQQLFHFIIIIMAAFFTDAILAFWLPSYIQTTFSSALIMGAIISFSSVVGFMTDFFFPQLFPNIHEKKTLRLTLFFQAIFVGLLILSLQLPLWWVFILAVSAWGVYFEFLSFSSKIYVSEHISKKLYTNTWANIDLAKSFAYLLGPIVAGILVENSNFSVLIVGLLAILVAQLLLSIFEDKIKHPEQEAPESAPKIEPKLELKHWLELSKKVWPIILSSFLITTIDATFWTTGTVLEEKILGEFPLAIFIIPLYMAPMLLAQIILSKNQLNQNKEKITNILLIINALILIIFSRLPIGYGLLVATFCIGFVTSLSYPIIESLYSDLEDRMGIHKKHLIGLSSSIYSLAYIITPLTAGLISQLFGEQETFQYLGIFVGLTAILILIFNRKKITIPQKEIDTWQEN